ncbi:MAG: Nin1 binding protein [Chrysothrix sp. TS-e1954]|nr:MAG: Nin1 binding protein [Chrysothrix sp. TS-e1954]
MTPEITAIVLDSGPLIKNEPSISSLLQRASKLVTLPTIVHQEIRDQATRSRLQTTVLPFLEIRTPSPRHLKAVIEFAKKTGDAAVLSRVDLELLALTRELECELNGGDWRIRKVPGEKLAPRPLPEDTQDPSSRSDPKQDGPHKESDVRPTDVPGDPGATPMMERVPDSTEKEPETIRETTEVLSQIHLNDSSPAATVLQETSDATPHAEDVTLEEDANSATATDSDTDSTSSEGWITPSNLTKHQNPHHNTPATPNKTPTPTKLQCCLITSDFAVQNTALMMNLNLLSTSTSMTRIRHLRTYILRCHACFKTCKDASRQFCPTCGGATLTRVTCTTDASGQFKLHLKKNMQWNTRGDRYSVPKPVPGSASGKSSVNRAGRRGGGKEGWGKELIFSEDQKEYERAVGGERRRGKERDLMDDDFLPGILSGDRSRNVQGRPRIGAGRNVNSKRRR